MEVFTENEQQVLTLRLFDNRAGRYVKASIYNNSFALIETHSLTFQAAGVYTKEINLTVGRYIVIFEVFSDAEMTIKDVNYSDTEETIKITLDTTKQVDELHKINGLDSANPMTVTESQRVAGSITQNFSGDGINSTTVTRA